MLTQMKLFHEKIPWSQSASELYRPSDRRLSAKLVPTSFADRGCHVVSVTNPYGRILGFLDQSRYYFFQVAPLFHENWRKILATDSHKIAVAATTYASRSLVPDTIADEMARVCVYVHWRTLNKAKLCH
jgi:hypothetical protein